MHSITLGAGSVVAGETQDSVSSLDAAVASQSRMCASVVDAATESRLPIATTQTLLTNLAQGIGNLVASRANLADAVRELTLIQARSTLRETSFGCPDGGETAPLKEFFTGASATTRVSVRSDLQKA